MLQNHNPESGKSIITSIRFGFSTPKRKPQLGDRRITKRHGLQVRVFSMYNGAYLVSNGRQLYEWVTLEKCPDRFKYLFEEKHKGHYVSK